MNVHQSIVCICHAIVCHSFIYVPNLENNFSKLLNNIQANYCVTSYMTSPNITMTEIFFLQQCYITTLSIYFNVTVSNHMLQQKAECNPSVCLQLQLSPIPES